nr:hypothetical protein [Pseudomonas aeruginosa]
MADRTTLPFLGPVSIYSCSGREDRVHIGAPNPSRDAEARGWGWTVAHAALTRLDNAQAALDAAAIQRAEAFCVAAHCAVGQTRKGGTTPYWHHPFEVRDLLLKHVPSASQEMLIAALLHDVIEDTAVSAETVAQLFGDEIAALVVELTSVSCKEDGARAVRKEIDRQHTAKASAAAKTIKLADVICNVSTVEQVDPDFARTYIPEKRKLLEVLVEGDATLYAVAAELLNKIGS